MKKLLSLAALLATMAVAQAQLLYTASLDGAQDGGDLRQGTGFVDVQLNGTTLTFQGSFSGLTTPASLAHIHGPSGLFPASATVIYNLGNNGIPLGATSGTINGTVNLVPLQSGNYTVAEQIDDLNNSQWYFNIHNNTFGQGEIRGQIIPVPEPSSLALIGLGLGSTLLWLRRRKS